MGRFYDLVAPVLGAGIGVALLGVLVLLLWGRFYRYWMVLAYVTWELLATLAFTIADVSIHGTSATTVTTRTAAQLTYARLYWTNDVLVDLFRFVLVLVLIYLASEGSRRIPKRVLAVLVIAMLVLPFVLFDAKWRPGQIGPLHVLFPSTLWFSSTSELLNFGAAIMNLMLWGLLLATRKRDPQLLLVSLGLGIVVTGTSFAYGLRHLFRQEEFRAVTYLFMNLCQLVGWLIWCRAFRPAKKPREIAAAPVVSQ